jgi:hypothetical protein
LHRQRYLADAVAQTGALLVGLGFEVFGEGLVLGRGDERSLCLAVEELNHTGLLGDQCLQGCGIGGRRSGQQNAHQEERNPAKPIFH